MTETPEIPEAAIEDVAKAIYEAPHDGLSRNGYNAAPRDIKDLYRAEAKLAVAAVLPHLKADDGCTGAGRGTGSTHTCPTCEPTFTASEVKELTATATAVALALGRREAGEEIAAAITKAGEERTADRHHGHEEKRDHGSTRYAAYLDAATIARNIASRVPGGGSDGLTAPSGQSDPPEMIGGSKTPLRRDATYPMDEPLTNAMRRALGKPECPGCEQDGVAPESHLRDCELNPLCGCIIGTVHLRSDHDDLTRPDLPEGSDQ